MLVSMGYSYLCHFLVLCRCVPASAGTGGSFTGMLKIFMLIRQIEEECVGIVIVSCVISAGGTKECVGLMTD